MEVAEGGAKGGFADVVIGVACLSCSWRGRAKAHTARRGTACGVEHLDNSARAGHVGSALALCGSRCGVGGRRSAIRRAQAASEYRATDTADDGED